MTTALVLCGGAAHGAIEVGLYRALVELGIEFDFIVGTSIGAVNGALIAAGLSPAELAERWRHIRTSDVLDFRRGWLRLLRNAPALCDGWRTEQFIRRLLPFHTFMHLPRRLAVGVGSVSSGMRRPSVTGGGPSSSSDGSSPSTPLCTCPAGWPLSPPT